MDNFETNHDQELDALLADIYETFDLNTPEEKPEAPAKAEVVPEKEPAAKEPTDDAKKTARSWQKNVLVYAHDLLHLMALFVVITVVFRLVVVSGTSMTNTLQHQDMLLVLSNVFYKDPKAGDVIVACKDSFDNGSPIIKRVIATEGQWVDIDFENGIVYVGDDQNNMKPLDEPYTRTPTNIQEGVKFPLQVKEGYIFVLGDNRNGSRDSRYPGIGLIEKREVLGKALFLFFPGPDVLTKERDFSRIGVVN